MAFACWPWASPPTSHIISLRLWTAAIASAAWRGKGDKNATDDARVERAPTTTYRLTVVLPSRKGEATHLLYIEAVDDRHCGASRLAVDPLNANNCADDQPIPSPS